MHRTITCLIFAATASLYANAGLAGAMCHGPSAPTTFPEPTTATEQDIIAAQQSVKQYLSDMESALKCIDAGHDTSAHNNAIDDMEKTAAKFNGVLRAFKARQKA
jgi:hypothetical protein